MAVCLALVPAGLTGILFGGALIGPVMNNLSVEVVPQPSRIFGAGVAGAVCNIAGYALGPFLTGKVWSEHVYYRQG